MTEPVRNKQGLALYRDITTGALVTARPEDIEGDPRLSPVGKEEYESEKSRDALRELNESALGQVATFGSRALTGMSSLQQGLLAAAARGVGADEVANEIAVPAWTRAAELLSGKEGLAKRLSTDEAVLSETNPISGLAGELGPAIAGGFATGGLATVGKGAATGLTRGVTSAAARQALIRTGQVAGVAVEGAAWGVAQAEQAARLAQQEDGPTAEQLGTSVALGSLLNIGGYAVAGGIGKMLSKRPKKLAEALVEPEGEFVERTGIAGKLADMTENAQVMMGAPRESLEKFTKGKNRDHWANVVIERQTRAIEGAKSLGESLKAIEGEGGIGEQIQKLVGNIDNNTELTRKLMPMHSAEARSFTERTLKEQATGIAAKLDESSRGLVAAMEDESVADILASSQEGRAVLLDLKRSLNLYRAEAERIAQGIASKKMDSAAGYSALNRLKQDIDARYAGKAGRKGFSPNLSGTPEDLFVRFSSDLNSASEAGGVMSELRTFLENPELFGARAWLQREMNSGLHEALRTNQRFGMAVTNKREVNYAGRYNTIINQSDMPSLYTEIGRTPDGEASLVLEQRGRGYKKAMNALKATEELHGINVDKQLEALDRSLNAINKSREESIIIEHFRRLTEAQSATDATKATFPLGAAAIGGVLGSAVAPGVGTVLGSLAGLGASAVMRPASYIIAGARARKFFGALRQKMSGEVSSEFLGRRAARRALVGSGVRKLRGPATGKIAAILTGRDDQSDEDAFNEVAERVERFNATPGAVLSAASDSLAEIAQGDPELAGLAANQAVNVMTYLGKHLPPGYEPPGMLGSTKRAVPKDEMARFAGRVKAAMDPFETAIAIARGKAGPEQIDAIRSLYPQVYKQIQERVMADAIEHARTNKIPYSARLAIDHLLEMDGKSVPHLSHTVGQFRAARGGRQKAIQPYSPSIEQPDANWPSKQ